LPNFDAIAEHLAKLGIPTIKQSVGVALEMLFPQPYTPGNRTPITNLYVIGNDVPSAERDRLVEWLREEGGGPYIYVRGPNPLEQNATLPFHYIEPNQTVGEVAALLMSYLEKL